MSVDFASSIIHWGMSFSFIVGKVVIFLTGNKVGEGDKRLDKVIEGDFVGDKNKAEGLNVVFSMGRHPLIEISTNNRIIIFFTLLLYSSSFSPNGLALSRLADCAYAGSVYNKHHRRL